MTVDANVAPRLPWIRLRQTHIPAVAVALCVSALTVAAAWALSLDRKALWPVVRACVAAYQLSGRPFPCLEVDLSRGEADGFVILRPPVGPPDTILAPTRRLSGVEAPFLQTPEAPNYFADAWRARRFLDEGGTAPDPDRVALVVNSRVNRSQDQLHIHIGCLEPPVEAAVRAFGSTAPLGAWIKVGRSLPGYWGLRTGQSDLANVDPFRLAAAAFGNDERRRADLTIAAARHRGEVVLLVSTPNAPGRWEPIGAESFLDFECAPPLKPPPN